MKIFAHRGSSGTYPENTSIAFQNAAKLPIAGVELDVQLTKDGEIVVIHDETIDRTSNGQGFVKDMTFEQLQTYDFGIKFAKKFAGEKIPLLADVLDLYASTDHIINIELKTNVIRYEGIEKKVVALIREKALENRVIISSFNHDSLRVVKEIDPSLQTAALTMKEIQDSFHFLQKLGANALHISNRKIRKPATRKLIAQGVLVRVFTINKPRQARRLKKVGVDAIFTDFPKKMIDVLA